MKAAQHETWREKQVTRRLLQEKDDEVMQLLEVSQTDMEAAIDRGKAEFDVHIKAENRRQQRVSNKQQHLWNKAMKSRATAWGRKEADRRGFDAVIRHLKDEHNKEMG